MTIKTQQVVPYLTSTAGDLLNIVDTFSEELGNYLDFAYFEEMLFAQGHFHLYLAYLDEKLDGFVIVLDRGDGIGLLQLMHVKSKGKGVGKALIEDVALHFPKLWLTVGTSNVYAQIFYKKVGFNPHSAKPNHFDVWEFDSPQLNQETHTCSDGLLMANYDVDTDGFGKPHLFRDVDYEGIKAVSKNTDVATAALTLSSLPANMLLNLSILMDECEDEHYCFADLEDLIRADATVVLATIQLEGFTPVVGYALFVPRSSSKSVYVLDSLYVHPLWRNQKIALCMVDKLGHKQIFAVVGVDNKPALYFYKSLGWKVYTKYLLPTFFNVWQPKSKRQRIENQLFSDGIIVANYSTRKFGFGTPTEVKL